mgnify:CR=1 FL=1
MDYTIPCMPSVLLDFFVFCEHEFVCRMLYLCMQTDTEENGNEN